MTRFIPSKNLRIKVLKNKSPEQNNIDYSEGKKDKKISLSVKKTDLNTIVANFLKHQNQSSRVEKYEYTASKSDIEEEEDPKSTLTVEDTEPTSGHKRKSQLSKFHDFLRETFSNEYQQE